MPAHRFPARPKSHAASALPALDFGLRLRVEAHPRQRTVFSSAEGLSVRQLTSELSEMLSTLRVRSFGFRSGLEQVTCALMVNVESGFWPQALRAATDLGDLLSDAGRRRVADTELCLRGANAAFRIADLCAREVR